ncbi:hypothetical protein PIB30_033606 [Stylosanthes scabra]|uniref:Uncharacterized protein n=1 Tax=Stylosanthes scabra TaxID=79078 RepID=A0ABU6ZBH4_9FABA|nr:hypothetical protein [Stylosanthes scabra]
MRTHLDVGGTPKRRIRHRCWIGSLTPPPYLHRLRVNSSNADLLESIMGSVPHSWYAKDMRRFLLGDSSSDLGHSSDYRDNDPTPVLDILTWLHPVTPFLNVPTPSARDKGFQLQRRKCLPRAGVYIHLNFKFNYEDSDERVNSDLVVVKTRRYHFDDEPFTHPLHSVRFDPNHPYELPVKSLLGLRLREPSKKKDSTSPGSGSSRRTSPTPQYSPLGSMTRLGSKDGFPYSRPTEEGDEVEKNENDIGIDEEGDKNEEAEEEEEYPVEDVPEEEMLAIPRPMDMEADEDYLQYLEELQRRPEYSLAHSNQAFAQHPSDDMRSKSSDGHSQHSFNLSDFWPPLVGAS